MSRLEEAKKGADRGKEINRKDLRHNAREAQEHLTAHLYTPIFSYNKPGRGVEGESSN